MEGLLQTVISTICTVIISLTVTTIFNKAIGIPKELRKQRELAAQKEAQHQLEDQERDAKIAALETAVNALPSYRAQSLQIQAQLQSTDQDILAACADIKNSVLENQHVLNERLDRLEKREKNSIRAKLIDEYRLFTDEVKNPMLAWSEMEHHAFFALVADYEDLHGNDYVHGTVIPAMNELEVVPMSDKQRLLQLMSSRRL
jgi:multidrug efflux pump subunit AcrA (membrane-fusion protein)